VTMRMFLFLAPLDGQCYRDLRCRADGRLRRMWVRRGRHDPGSDSAPHPARKEIRCSSLHTSDVALWPVRLVA